MGVMQVIIFLIWGIFMLHICGQNHKRAKQIQFLKEMQQEDDLYHVHHQNQIHTHQNLAIHHGNEGSCGDGVDCGSSCDCGNMGMNE